MQLSEITNDALYLTTLISNYSKYIIIIAARDNIGKYMSEEIADLFIKLGICDLHPKRSHNGFYQFPYIAVINGGKLVYEKLGDKGELSLEYQYQEFNILSTRYNSEVPAFVSIKYKGYDYASVRRGLNLLVVDQKSGEAVDTVLFDYSEETAEFSRPFLINDIKAYEEFRKEFECKDLPKLALHIPEYPYGDTVIIQKREKNFKLNDKIKGLCSDNGLNFYHINDAVCITSSELKTDINGINYIFHGVARWEDKFIIGSNDIERYNIDIKEIRENVGCFALIIIEDNNIEISCDWFGSQALFYYQSDNLTAVSSSYHLLLLALKAYEEKLYLDTKRVSVAQSFFGALFENGLSYEKDVKGVIEAPPDMMILIDNSANLLFKKTSLYYEKIEVEEYSEERYEELLLKARNEIIANCRAVFEHPEIEYVVSDLSGGGDSRLILAAITNLPQSLQKKLRINTVIHEDLSKDYEIACKIVSAFNLKWDDVPRTTKIFKHNDRNGYILSPRSSKQLGMSSEFSDYASREVNDHMIQFTGAYGEIISQPIGYMFTENKKSLPEVIRIMCKSYDIKNSPQTVDYTKKCIQYFVDNSKSDNIETVFSYTYLYFMARHHFISNLGCGLIWTPLMTKTGYHLRRMYIEKYEDYKLRFDLMEALNPLISCFEYDTAKINKEKEELYSRLRHPLNVKVNVGSLYQVKKYEEVKNSRKNYYYPTINDIKRANNETRFLYNSRLVHLSALKIFLDYSSDFDEIGFPLFCFFNRDNKKTNYHPGFRYELNRINRLLQIFWIIQIINGEY